MREVASEKVPLGAVHVLLVALPPIEPAKVIVPPEQTVCTEPALALAAWLLLNVTVEVLVQEPLDIAH